MNYYGLDIGTARIRFFDSEEILFDQPALIAYDSDNDPIAIGDKAHALKGSGNVRPLDTLEALFLYCNQIFDDYHIFGIFKKTTVLFSCPVTFSDTEKEEIKTYLLKQGAMHAVSDIEIWYAALGSQINIDSDLSSCILHIGHDNTSIGVFSKNQIDDSAQNPIAGRQLEQQIRRWILEQCHLQISDHVLSDMKLLIGQCVPQPFPQSFPVQGFDTRTQKSRSMQFDENQFVQAVSGVLYQWSNWIYQFLSTLSPITQQQIAMRGIICCGGTFLLRNLEPALQNQLNIPFYICPKPDQTVIRGMQVILTRMEEGL